MARGVMFRYRYGTSSMHRLDLRIKVTLAIFYGGLVLWLPYQLLPIPFAILLIAWFSARLTLVEVGKALAPFLLLLLFLSGVPLIGSAHPVEDGLRSLESSARFLLLILSAHWLTTLTSPAEIAEAVRFFLGWLGKKNAEKAAVMAALTIGFLPRILDQARSLREAAELRGWSIKKRPFEIVRIWTIPLLRTLMEKSTWTAWAIELRGYDPDRFVK